MLHPITIAKGFDTKIWVRPSGSTLNPNPKVGADIAGGLGQSRHPRRNPRGGMGRADPRERNDYRAV
jgi:hypothetical protein